MGTIISIKVFDPVWLKLKKEEIDYWGEIKEADDIKNMKYQQCVVFKFNFPILDCIVNRDTNAILSVRNSNNRYTHFDVPDTTTIEFRGKEQKGEVIISNDLIFGDFTAKKRRSTNYHYIYLDGRKAYYRLAENIWLSEMTLSNLLEIGPINDLEFDKNYETISYSGRIS